MAKDSILEPIINSIHAIVIACVRNVADDGIEVAYVGPDGQVQASAFSTVPMSIEDIGSEVAISFVDGDPGKPIVLGRILQPAISSQVRNEVALIDDSLEPLEITGEREITLRCGKASITLTKAGKIILRGTYISSRSSGMNRIKGGSVQLN